MIDIRRMVIDRSWAGVRAGKPSKECARCGAECMEEFVWPLPDFPDEPGRQGCILCSGSEELGLWLAARDKAMNPWP